MPMWNRVPLDREWLWLWPRRRIKMDKRHLRRVAWLLSVGRLKWSAVPPEWLLVLDEMVCAGVEAPGPSMADEMARHGGCGMCGCSHPRRSACNFVVGRNEAVPPMPSGVHAAEPER